MSAETETPAGGAVAKMSVPTLTAMVVGGMVGAGVFSLPARFGVATGVLGALIAWSIREISRAVTQAASSVSTSPTTTNSASCEA